MAKVLIIDDNDLNRTVLERRLARRGHEVLQASSTEQGLASAAATPPHAVLLNANMPGSPDGWGVASRLAEIPGFTAAIVGMVRSSADVERGTGGGFAACLPMPVDAAALHGVLDRLLRERGVAAPEPRAQPSQRRPVGDPPRLLVVDDEAFNRDMLSRRLSRRGYNVRTATDGADCLDRLSETRFDLVLLDWMMPGMSGVEVLERIRAVFSASYLPVIMATAKVTSEDVVTALEAGANDYVTKPLDFPVVLARIQSQLDVRAASEAVRVSDARFRHLAESSPDLITRLSPDGIFLYCSPASRELLGYEPSELVGRNAHDLVHADDFADLAERLMVDDEATSQFTVVCRVARRDGEYGWFEIAYRVLRDPSSGEVAELQATYRNVTGQVKAREDLLERVLVHVARTTERRSAEADGHVLRVGRTAEILALRLNQGALRAELIRRAAMFHDYGNIVVPVECLERPGPLGEADWKLIHTHTTAGYDLLRDSGSEMLELAAMIALNHHERHDGKGYPRGRRGRSIPLEARLVAIADVFDALTSARVWRPAYSVAEASEMIRAGSGTQFDPELVEQFCAILDQVVALRDVWPDA